MQTEAGKENCFRIKTSSGKTLLLSCDNKQQLIDWLNTLQECIAKPDNPVRPTAFNGSVFYTYFKDFLHSVNYKLLLNS